MDTTASGASRSGRPVPPPAPDDHPRPTGEALGELVPLVVSAPVTRRAASQEVVTGTRPEGGGATRWHRPAPARVRTVQPRTPRPRAVRLTARGHVAVVVLIATAIATASGVIHAHRAGPSATAPVATSQEVVVRPGDTLASIASRIAPADEHAAVVALIRAANGLHNAADAPLPAGEYLIVPAA